MKEHESRLITDITEAFYHISNGKVHENNIYRWEGASFILCYVDCNNFIHNLDGPAWENGGTVCYYIHGKIYYNKGGWEIEVNRIKMLEEI